MESSTLFIEAQSFVGVDFHIHTPSSHCYKGSKSEEEYLEILRRYNLKNIKVIAITDHNTIKGYKKFLNIKNELKDRLSFLNEYKNNHPSLLEDYFTAKMNLELFSNVYLIPGIEFEVNPGIHILLLFDPKTEVETIDKFLIDSGYIEEVQGKENPGIISNLDVISLLDKSKDLGAIVIAAHADSDKGIYNDLEGLYRANVFRSNQLTAISYNNPKNYQKMKLLLQNKEYLREMPLAFIQSSDNHGQLEAGTNISYLKLNEISFDAIIQALRNPNECISPTERPEVINILHEIVSDSKTIVFSNIETELEQMDIKRAICAIINDGYGTIVIGVTTNPELVVFGVSKKDEGVVEKLFTEISPIWFSVDIKEYPFGFNKKVIRINIERKTNKIFYFQNNEVYILQNNKVKLANPSEIEEIIEDRMIKRMTDYQKITQSKLDRLIIEINQVKERTIQISLVNKIERESKTLSLIANTEVINSFIGELEIQKINNGSLSGNVIVIERAKPRLPYAYLRYSAPRTNKYNAENLNIPKFKNEAIIIAPGGGSYYINSLIDETWCVISLDKEVPAIVLSIKDSFKNDISALSLLGWIKSSLHIWYCNLAFDGINIHRQEIFKNMNIPILKSLKPGGVVENLTLEILKLESVFLSIDVIEIESKQYSEITYNHNVSVEKLALQIDQILFEDFGVTVEDVEMLKRTFFSKNIYFPRL